MIIIALFYKNLPIPKNKRYCNEDLWMESQMRKMPSNKIGLKSNCNHFNYLII